MHKISAYQVEPLVVHLNFTFSLSSQSIEDGGSAWRGIGSVTVPGRTLESETTEVAAFECIVKLGSMDNKR